MCFQRPKHFDEDNYIFVDTRASTLHSTTAATKHIEVATMLRPSIGKDKLIAFIATRDLYWSPFEACSSIDLKSRQNTWGDSLAIN